MGARAGYSILNGVSCDDLSHGHGRLHRVGVPIDAGMAIVLWIGIVITAQASRRRRASTRPRSWSGCCPASAAWGALMAKNGLRAAASDARRAAVQRGGGPPLPGERHLDRRRVRARAGLHLHLDRARGGHGERDRAALAASGGRGRRVAALLSACGLMHSYQWTFGDTALKLAPAWPFVIGYAGMSLLFLSAQWTTEEGGEY